jgi:CubicO group peptidase (beta-lactamase class C family)
VASPESQGIDPSVLKSALVFLDKRSGGVGTAEMVVVRNGVIIWQGPSAEAFHTIQSGTKTFTTTVLGLLIQEGRISSIDARAVDYLPSLDDRYADYAAITFRHLASFTSGYNAGSPPSKGMPWGDPRKFLTPMRPLAYPGTRSHYFDPPIHQLGNILTVASGDTLENIFRTRIAEAIGMKNWEWRHCGYHDGGRSDAVAAYFVNPSGIYGGGIHSTPLDIARYGLLYLNRGRWNGKQVLSSQWVDEATRNQVPILLMTGPFDRRGHFGFMWYTNETVARTNRPWPSAPPGTYTFQGGGRNYCFVVPEWNMVIARMSPPDKSAMTRHGDPVWEGFFKRLEPGIS